jgi:hypothetical protein
MATTPEEVRLEEDRMRLKHWKRWGPYLSERAWGSVREDYSPGGDAWDYFPHDHARSRAYRWNEDGLAGISDDLTTRAADVILKERRKLILVIRDTPYSLVHIKNMETVTLAGGIICPASPSFYSKPNSIEELAGTVVNRVLDLCGFRINSFRWGNEL